MILAFRHRPKVSGSRRLLALAAAAASLCPGVAAAQMTLTKAAIEAGKLVIEGKSTIPGSKVFLSNTTFSAPVASNGAFSFALVYLPPTCKILLLGEKQTTVTGVVTGCAPAGRPGLRGPQGPKGEPGLPGPGMDWHGHVIRANAVGGFVIARTTDPITLLQPAPIWFTGGQVTVKVGYDIQKCYATMSDLHPPKPQVANMPRPEIKMMPGGTDKYVLNFQGMQVFDGEEIAITALCRP